MLCDHLEGWDREGGREMQKGGDMGIYVYVELIHFVIKQKLTHHCKAKKSFNKYLHFFLIYIFCKIPIYIHPLSP